MCQGRIRLVFAFGWLTFHWRCRCSGMLQGYVLEQKLCQAPASEISEAFTSHCMCRFIYNGNTELENLVQDYLNYLHFPFYCILNQCMFFSHQTYWITKKQTNPGFAQPVFDRHYTGSQGVYFGEPHSVPQKCSSKRITTEHCYITLQPCIFWHTS